MSENKSERKEKKSKNEEKIEKRRCGFKPRTLPADIGLV